jgi:hypothetical protein
MGKTTYRHTAEFGSSIAKGGFDNEQNVVDKFNNWKQDEQSQFCLKQMGYKLDDIEKVEAFLIRDIIRQSQMAEKHNPKSDMQVQVTIYLKSIPDPQNISVKLVSSLSGFNQIDKRWVDRYKEFWNLPNEIVELLKRFTGEIKPENNKFRSEKRVFLDELGKNDQQLIINFFEDNKVTIVSDILKGRGAFSAQWMLVVHKIKGKESIWSFKSINEVINHYSKGVVKITPRGSLAIGRLTAQRKGGDNGRETANMLQFKFNPLELLAKKL